MLNIYTGREDIDKQRYMFARIQRQDIEAERRQRIFLIVPDQFTLETERSAFSYMDARAFVNPIILSMNRLAGKTLAEAGERADHIDRYGNYMLLARLLYRNREGLELYRDLENSTKFIAQLGEAIVSLKSHMVTPGMLTECAEAAEAGKPGGLLLGKKLRDVAAIYTAYEESLAGGVPDGADITRRFVELIPDSKLLDGAIVWISGFDYFSPLHQSAIGAMAARAAEVNVVLTGEPGAPFFKLTNGMAEALAEAAAGAGARDKGTQQDNGDGSLCLVSQARQDKENRPHCPAAQANIISVEKDAAERGVDCGWLPEDEKPPEIAHIERALFAGPVRPYTNGDGLRGSGDGLRAPQGTQQGRSFLCSLVNTERNVPVVSPAALAGRPHCPPCRLPHLRFVVAQNYYGEAEEAARAILRLVRDEGLRFRDILVVCNDQERRALAIQRVFRAYGIETFLDKRHEAGYNPALAYITILPELVSKGRRSEDVLRWIATGLTDVAQDDAEELENYIERYGLRGSAWKRPLKFGANAYDEEVFSRIGNAVKYVGDMTARFAERFEAGNRPSSEKKSEKRAASARARTEGLKAFLEKDARLPERIAEYADKLEAEGFLEYASQMRGIWDVALGIFSQITAAFGDVATSAEEYSTILRVGFSSVIIGMLPASSDCVTIGTMQRTRTGRVKAMFVFGANDGELPMFAEDDGLLDDSEKETLEGLGLTAFRREENLQNEEQLAIYKNLSKPTRLLQLSYTAFGSDGQTDARPSRIFERLRALFPDTRLETAGAVHVDKATAGTVLPCNETAGAVLVDKNESTGSEATGLVGAILADKNESTGSEATGLVGAVAVPLSEKSSPIMPLPQKALRPLASPDGCDLGAERMRQLIPPVLSPTSIEKYSRCPFAFLMERGLKLGEIRKHEIDSRGMGDVYHEALKRFGDAMNGKGGPPKNENSAWNTATRADTDALVEEVFRGIGSRPLQSSHLSEEAALLFDAHDPAAAYRLGRLKSIVRDVCWSLTRSASGSGIEQMIFEADFGAGGGFDMVRIGAKKKCDGSDPVGGSDKNGGEELCIAGRIDRIDVLPGRRAKVLDYKSGYEKWNSENVKNGWQLQLMLYLKAIESAYEPVGVSYFRIFEPSINLSGAKAPATPEEIREEALKEYRSDGVFLETLEPLETFETLESESSEEGSSKSKTRTRTGEKILPKKDFDELRYEVDERLSKIAAGLSRGETPASPKQKAGGDHVTACTWCNYLSICNFQST